MIEFFGPGECEDGHWKWKWEPERNSDEETYRSCAQLMERLLLPKTQHIPSETARLDSNPHAELCLQNDTLPHPAIEPLLNAVKAMPLPPTPQPTPDMKPCKLSTVHLFCKALGLNRAQVVAHISAAEKEDSEHFQREFLISTNFHSNAVPTNLWLYCTETKVHVSLPELLSWERLKPSRLYDEYLNACHYRPLSERKRLYLVFGKQPCQFIMYRSVQGYQGIGGIFVSEAASEGYVIEPLENWIRFNMKPPIE